MPVVAVPLIKVFCVKKNCRFICKTMIGLAVISLCHWTPPL